MDNKTLNGTPQGVSVWLEWLRRIAAWILLGMSVVLVIITMFALMFISTKELPDTKWSILLVVLLSAGAGYSAYFGGLLRGRFRSSENRQMRHPVIHWVVGMLEASFALVLTAVAFFNPDVFSLLILFLGILAGVSAYRRGKRLAAYYRSREKTEMPATAWRLTGYFVFAMLWSAGVAFSLYGLTKAAELPDGAGVAPAVFMTCLGVFSACAAYRCWRILAEMFRKYAQQQKSW